MSKTSAVDLSQLREHSTSVNLTTLQKKDSNVTRLLYTGKHVTLYHLNTHTSAFDRQEVEGPLFLVERRTQPTYQLCILNRKSITDWRYDITPQLADAMEIQEGKFLHFQSSQGGLVITLWFHEETECTNLHDLLKRLCAHMKKQQMNGAPIQPFELAPPTQPSSKSHNHAHHNSMPQPLTHKSMSAPIVSSSPRANNTAAPAAVPIQSLHAPSKSFTSPYAPPPPVELNVAVPYTKENERMLAQRLNGFLTSLAHSDAKHTQAYQQELSEIENKKKENAKKYQDESKAQKLDRKPSTNGNHPPATTSSSPPPTMLSPDQLSMLQSFSSSSNLMPPQPAPSHTQPHYLPPTSALPQPMTASVESDNNVERNLAAAKARKAARNQQATTAPAAFTNVQQPQPPTFVQPPSTLPASLLFAAAQQQQQQHQPYPPMPIASNSPPIRPSVPTASTVQPDIHPLLALMNSSAASQSQSFPSQPPQSQSALLAPSHFLTAPAPSTTTTPALTSSQLLTPQSFLVNSQQQPILPSAHPPQVPSVKSKSEFHTHIISLCNDPATLDWLYQRYLTRPNQHPFA